MKHAFSPWLLGALALLGAACQSSGPEPASVVADADLPADVQEALAEARAAGVPVYIDFHAEW